MYRKALVHQLYDCEVYLQFFFFVVGSSSLLQSIPLGEHIAFCTIYLMDISVVSVFDHDESIDNDIKYKYKVKDCFL